MKAKNSINRIHPLSKLIIRHILVFAVVLFVLSIFFYYLILSSISTVSPFSLTQNLITKVSKMDDLDFMLLNAERYVGKNGDLLLFDESGTLIYTNDNLFYSDILKTELEIIPEYNSKLKYALSGFNTPQGEKRYVLTTEILNSNGVKEIQDFVLMDDKLQILSSTFSVNRSGLTMEEISYLTGENKDNSLIRKLSFSNPSGKKRILVFSISSNYQTGISKLILQSINLWLLIIPAIILALVILINCLSKSIFNLLKPLESITNHPYMSKFTLTEESVSSNEYLNIANKYENLYDDLVQSEWERLYLDGQKNQFLSDISHDLKTPITVIHGYSRALRDGLIPVYESNKYLNIIYQNSERLAELVSTFHEYSILNHPDMPIHLKKLNICSIIQIYFAKKYPELELNGMLLVADIPEFPIYCNIDEKLFCRVLENLVSNSIKYNDMGATIFLKIENQVETVMILIGDSGNGIPESVVDRLFSPFVTGDSSLKHIHGSGLGLSIAKKIIASHHGTIEYRLCTNQECKTNFMIELPTIE